MAQEVGTTPETMEVCVNAGITMGHCFTWEHLQENIIESSYTIPEEVDEVDE